ncbi:hypothetical protein ACP70R_026253 [Stipagrostis hirtigluma subsp. patula]
MPPDSGLAFPVCSRFPPGLIFSSPLAEAASAMNCGGGRVGGGDGGNCRKPPPPGVHPRYIPERGAVLKGIVRAMLRCFLLISPPMISGPVSSGGRRVRPAPLEAGGDAAEQGE